MSSRSTAGEDSHRSKRGLSRTTACATKCVTPLSRSSVEASETRPASGCGSASTKNEKPASRRLLGLAVVRERRLRRAPAGRRAVQRPRDDLQRVLDRAHVEPEQPRHLQDLMRAPSSTSLWQETAARRPAARSRAGRAVPAVAAPRGRAGSPAPLQQHGAPARRRAGRSGRTRRRRRAEHVLDGGAREPGRDHVDDRGRESLGERAMDRRRDVGGERRRGRRRHVERSS